MRTQLLSLISIPTLFTCSVSAQTTTNDDVLINGDNGTVNLKVTGNNGSLFTGTFGSGTIPVTGAGTRMMWYPKKAAFRVGTTSAGEWDDSSVGAYSFGGGYSTEALGEYSFAYGFASVALGSASFAGGGAVANADYSTAFGAGAVYGSFGFAAGYGSVGNGTYSSTALGSSSCEADYGTASGAAYVGSNAGTAFGYNAASLSYGEVALGLNNAFWAAGDPDDWVANDALLMLGNGVDWEYPSNAVVVQKDGDIRVSGKGEYKGGIRAKH